MKGHSRDLLSFPGSLYMGDLHLCFSSVTLALVTERGLRQEPKRIDGKLFSPLQSFASNNIS